SNCHLYIQSLLPGYPSLCRSPKKHSHWRTHERAVAATQALTRGGHCTCPRLVQAAGVEPIRPCALLFSLAKSWPSPYYVLVLVDRQIGAVFIKTIVSSQAGETLSSHIHPQYGKSCLT